MSTLSKRVSTLSKRVSTLSKRVSIGAIVVSSLPTLVLSSSNFLSRWLNCRYIRMTSVSVDPMIATMRVKVSKSNVLVSIALLPPFRGVECLRRAVTAACDGSNNCTLKDLKASTRRNDQ